MSPEGFENLLVIVLGFAVGGLLSSAYQIVADRPASFAILTRASRAIACAHLPLLVFAAPYLIVRALAAGAGEGPRDVFGVALATLFAAFWSLMSGTVVLLAMQALGVV